MKPGQKFKIDCPAKFAYGSASPFGMESDHIPENSDLTYEVEVIACTQLPKAKMDKKAKKALKKAQKAKKPKKNETKVVEMKSISDEKKEIEADEKIIKQDKIKIKQELVNVPVIEKEISKEKEAVEKD